MQHVHVCEARTNTEVMSHVKDELLAMSMGQSYLISSSL